MGDYIIDSVFPTRRVHLIGGQSNVGKTRWVLPMMVQWSKGQPIMGFTSHPAPWAYVSGDRLLIEAQDTIRGLGLSLKDIPIIPAFGRDNKPWYKVILEAAEMGVEVLVWEGFGDLAPDPQRRTQVREFLSSVCAACAETTAKTPNGMTILGIMESPKMKPHEKYKNPRERISGVASWGYHTSSVILLEHAKPESPSDQNRILQASLKLAPSFTSLGRFDRNGTLTFGLPEIIDVVDEAELETELARLKDFMKSHKTPKSSPTWH